MATFNYSNKLLIETELENGTISDSCILNSDLDSLHSENKKWVKTDITNTNCNDAVFISNSFSDCNFYRSSLINSCFNKCKLNNISFSGISLIKLKLLNSRIAKQSIDSCTLQRAEFNCSIFENSSFKNFEGVFAKACNTIFINCYFEISYDSGMNGFSSGIFEDCIFYNCNFSGYPLRGATTKNCTFINCSGEITDDAICSTTYGLPHYPSTEKKEISNIDIANKIINEAS